LLTREEVLEDDEANLRRPEAAVSISHVLDYSNHIQLHQRKWLSLSLSGSANAE
jgi:hypothetical protein